MNSKWDAIVVGAGLGGLGSAVTLAQAGKRVLVLEQANKPGGYAQDFRIGDYRFDVSLHAMDGLAPGGWGDVAMTTLGLADKIRFERLDPFYRARLGGIEFSAHADTLTFEKELADRFPAEKTGIRRLIDAMLQVFHDMRRIREDTRKGPPDGNIAELFPLLVRAMSCTWGEFMADYLKDPDLRAVFSTEWTYYGLPASRLNAATMASTWASYHFYGAWYPKGGVGAIVKALTDRLGELGGVLQLEARVEKILVADGIATGVRLTGGTELASRTVISNASAPQTLLQLLDADCLPTSYSERIRSAEPSLSTLNVYLGVSVPAESLSDCHEIFISGELDSDAQYAAILAGDWSRVPFLAVNYGLIDPSCAPPGETVVSLMSLAPWDYRNVWETGGKIEDLESDTAYRQLKEQAARQLIERAETCMPGLKGAIREKSVATPVTNRRWTLNPGGAIFGTAQTVDNMYLGRLAPKTWIPNLVLAGAWTTPGGGQSASLISGIHVGTRITEQLLAERTSIDSPPAVDPPLAEEVPEFGLTSVHYDRQVTHESIQGHPQVLLFHTKQGAEHAGALNKRLRQRFPMAAMLGIASVVAMGKVPGVMRGAIRKMLSTYIGRAASSIPPVLNAADYLVILPDWGNGATRAFGVDPAGLAKGVVACVIDRSGKIQHRLADPSPEKLISIIEWM